MSPTKDPFQDRYINHQHKKQAQLKFCRGRKNWKPLPEKMKDHFSQLTQNRSTQRTFISETVSEHDIAYILTAATLCPSSCNRQAISIKLVTERNEKDLLSGLLVGGVGWCHRAHSLFLLFAHPDAYKAGNEISYMPYLDAGVMVQQMYLAATALNLGAGFVNPNIREENMTYFNQRFNPENLLYCGTLAVGKFDVKSEQSPKRSANEMLL